MSYLSTKYKYIERWQKEADKIKTDVMTHGWIYTDAQLLRDDIQTLFTAERY